MTPAQLLEPHAKRKIAVFVVLEFGTTGPSPDVYDAFWKLIYDGQTVAVDHETAIAVEHELCATDKRIRDVINGWRPESLAWAARTRGGDA